MVVPNQHPLWQRQELGLELNDIVNGRMDLVTKIHVVLPGYARRSVSFSPTIFLLSTAVFLSSVFK